VTKKDIVSALTLSRFPLGMLAAALLFLGGLNDGFAIYAVALATDALDGPLARRFECTSDWGRDWDRRADMFLNFLAFAGYEFGAYCIWGTPWTALAPLIAIGGIMLVTLPFFRRHSAASKLRSGVIRVLLVGFVAVNMDWNPYGAFLIAFVALFGIPAMIHEFKLTADEVRAGERRWFKSPPLRLVK